MASFFLRPLAVVLMCCVVVLGGVPRAVADEAAQRAELEAAWKAAQSAATLGPNQIKLRDQAALDLPQAMAFIPAAEGARFMRALGNTVNDGSFVGLVVPTAEGDWIASVNYHADGYVRDDDAKEWNPDDLLQSLKDGTEESNKDRARRGFPQVEVVGWIEKPAYDASAHRLVWSVLARQKGKAEATGVNYNTNALGRNGHFSLNMLTEQSTVEHDKVVARTLLGGLTFNAGSRYEEFNEKTDHVAAYGLAALLGAAVAKKVGLLAAMGLFFAKFAKVIVLAFAAFGAGILRFFRRKKAAPPTPPGAE